MEPKLVCTQSQSWNKKKGDKIGVKGKKISGQTLTHWGKYLDQNQEVDFQLELVQSSKWRSEIHVSRSNKSGEAAINVGACRETRWSKFDF